MEYLPSIDWEAARDVQRRWQADLPDVTRPEALTFVADLRIQARLAGRMAARAMRMPGEGAHRIRIVDRAGWGRAATRIAQSALERMGWSARPDTAPRRALGRCFGGMLGVGLSVASKWMLGQFDSFTGDDALYLVAPNIYALERHHGFVPRDFRRWVATHEHTHALQFQAAPWLRDHLVSLVAEAESRAGRDRIVGAMTFLEGHADYISDHTGRIRTASRMRRVFRGAATSPASLLNKAGQYVDGRRFCVEVRRLSSRGMLSLPFERPENLPTRGEIEDPRAWLSRVVG